MTVSIIDVYTCYETYNMITSTFTTVISCSFPHLLVLLYVSLILWSQEWLKCFLPPIFIHPSLPGWCHPGGVILPSQVLHKPIPVHWHYIRHRHCCILGAEVRHPNGMLHIHTNPGRCFFQIHLQPLVSSRPLLILPTPSLCSVISCSFSFFITDLPFLPLFVLLIFYLLSPSTTPSLWSCGVLFVGHFGFPFAFLHLPLCGFGPTLWIFTVLLTSCLKFLIIAKPFFPFADALFFVVDLRSDTAAFWVLRSLSSWCYSLFLFFLNFFFLWLLSSSGSFCRPPSSWSLGTRRNLWLKRGGLGGFLAYVVLS